MSLNVRCFRLPHLTRLLFRWSTQTPSIVGQTRQLERAVDGVDRRGLSNSVNSPTADGGADWNRPMWPMGTWDDPVPIASTGNARVVGCTGRHHLGEGVHILTWITVEKGKMRQCPCCEQVFKLEVRE